MIRHELQGGAGAMSRGPWNRAAWLLRVLAIGAALGGSAAVSAQMVRVIDETRVRTERATDAPPVATVPANSIVRLLQLKGGWAQIDAGSVAQRGWVRASLLDLRPPELAAVSQLETGRRADGATAVTLGVRSLPPRSNRHALIIGIGRYLSDVARPVEPLAGIDRDISSALLMSRALQVPNDHVTLLRDDDATRSAIEAAIAELAASVQTGDRVFVYWSGHGSRTADAGGAGCVDSLLTFDLQDVANDRLGVWLQRLVAKVDKLMLVIDVGHVAGAPGASAALDWQSKFTPPAGACRTSGSMRTRGLAGAASTLGVQDVVSLAAARVDEPAWQGADGGLATRTLRDCLRGDAHDDDGSGAVSAQEIAECAQAKIEQALAGTARITPHIVLSGNRDFVPAWFAKADVLSALAPVAATTRPAPLARVLEQIHGQRDGKRSVQASMAPERLHIGTDTLALRITSSHAGHVYIAMLGSDGQTLTLLFPNDKDSANRIEAGATLALPRASWQLTAGGPAGEDRLLVIVSDGPRDLAALGGAKAGPFVLPLTDRDGRAQLQWLLGNRTPSPLKPAEANAAGPTTASGCERDCSDAFGSALISVQEY